MKNGKCIMDNVRFKKNNEHLIAAAIDRHFGAGSYQKVKSGREAVQTLLIYIASHQFIAIRVRV